MTDPARHLQDPPADAIQLEFGIADLSAVRQLLGEFGRDAEVADERLEGFVLAVHEVAANSIVHGGETGHLGLWRGVRKLVCEIQSRSRITDPAAGTELPPHDETGGRGLWIANQLADRLEIRTSALGSAVRLELDFEPA
jgi:anti-sigma regulatory factor (Ser/Thr protein kinase)